MQVRVSLYGSLRRRLPPNASGISADVPLPEGATIGDLKSALGIPRESRLMVLLNGTRSGPDAQLVSGDEVVLAPVIGGG